MTTFQKFATLSIKTCAVSTCISSVYHNYSNYKRQSHFDETYLNKHFHRRFESDDNIIGLPECIKLYRSETKARIKKIQEYKQEEIYEDRTNRILASGFCCIMLPFDIYCSMSDDDEITNKTFDDFDFEFQRWQLIQDIKKLPDMKHVEFVKKRLSHDHSKPKKNDALEKYKDRVETIDSQPVKTWSEWLYGKPKNTPTKKFNADYGPRTPGGVLFSDIPPPDI